MAGISKAVLPCRKLGLVGASGQFGEGRHVWGERDVQSRGKWKIPADGDNGQVSWKRRFLIMTCAWTSPSSFALPQVKAGIWSPPAPTDTVHSEVG
ncbi:hypothetical protein BN1708_001629 [Verticillium longisporum]|uniref:Uncharacterized protein n=1 Tax=Verticillium longisporum TaxID=100787 RepID=A0A0G4MZ00_VERLO|nr:hypothetical protein BN1708_001629 [Verticillium longisporum]